MVKKEKCFGVIPLFLNKGNWEVFIIKHVKGGYWGFPKGHQNFDKELPIDVAKRELKEETFLDVIEFFKISPFVERYSFFRKEKKIEKEVCYFLAKTNRDFNIKSSEIEDGKWVNLKNVLDYLTFEESKTIASNVITKVAT